MAPCESIAWPLGTFGMFVNSERDVLVKPVGVTKLVRLLQQAVSLVFGSLANVGASGEGVRDGDEVREAQGR